MILEIVVYNLESAMMAQLGKANRIELCDNPSEGGTTPSVGMIEMIRKKINLDLFVMIRPRGGDFLYSDEEFDVMKMDIMAAKRAGADGVVFGILTSTGEIDSRCADLIQLAKPMSVTCHRAFDMTKDLSMALEDCVACGFDRILTSGGKPKAIEGVDVIADLNRQAKGRVKIMPGSGIDENNVRAIVVKTKVEEIHFSAVCFRESGMQFRNKDIAGMGNTEGGEFSLRTVDAGRIGEMRRLSMDEGR